MLDIHEITCVKKKGNCVIAIHGKIKDQPQQEPKLGTIFAKDGSRSILLKHEPKPVPVTIMKISETQSGEEIEETNIACFLAEDPKNLGHNLLEDYPECNDIE